MLWQISHRGDPVARAVADRHYNRQSIGHPQFVAPGRCMVLYGRTRRGHQALWITRWQYDAFCHHAWPGAWECSAFRNEGAGLSSLLIRDAVAATRAYMGDPPDAGMITFVRPDQVRPKDHPGRCFLLAGFEPCGKTGKGYLAFRLSPDAMPPPRPPRGVLL